MGKVEKLLFIVGLAAILVTNLVAIIQESQGWLFLGIVGCVIFYGWSYDLGNRRGRR